MGEGWWRVKTGIAEVKGDGVMRGEKEGGWWWVVVFVRWSMTSVGYLLYRLAG